MSEDEVALPSVRLFGITSRALVLTLQLTERINSVMDWLLRCCVKEPRLARSETCWAPQPRNH
jgi:hypothetical protein